MKSTRSLQLSLFAILMLILPRPALNALEEQIVLGRDLGWRTLQLTGTRIAIEGFQGYPDIMLQDAAYPTDAGTDLLLHFDSTDSGPARLRPHAQDGARIRWEPQEYYSLDPGMVEGETAIKVFGTGAGLFTAGLSEITAEARPGALFYPGTDWRDFTIEFWLYAAETESRQSILLWEGVTLPGEWGESIRSQELSCSIGSGRLTWELRNIFRPQNGDPFSVALQSRRELLPRQWHHHLIRFDSATGLIEYLVDGAMEDYAYANRDNRESDTLFMPYIGSAGNGILTIGSRLSGFLDELRVSSVLRRDVPPAAYRGQSGYALIEPLDLGYRRSRLVRITADATIPADSDIFYYYQLTDSPRSRFADDPNWIPFVPGAIFSPDTRGRYLHLMAALYPDGKEQTTPVLSDLTITYEPDLPPPPPSRLTAAPGNGSVRLSWDPVPDPDLEGYKIYYGTAPGRYFGTDGEQGASPVDIGRATEFELTGLENGRLYYFAVVAYDASGTPYQTVFSSEVSARPRELGRTEME